MLSRKTCAIELIRVELLSFLSIHSLRDSTREIRCKVVERKEQRVKIYFLARTHCLESQLSSRSQLDSYRVRRRIVPSCKKSHKGRNMMSNAVLTGLLELLRCGGMAT